MVFGLQTGPAVCLSHRFGARLIARLENPKPCSIRSIQPSRGQPHEKEKSQEGKTRAKEEKGESVVKAKPKKHVKSRRSSPKVAARGRAAAARKAARRVVEPSSGSESSSLDPKRLGRLTVGRPDVSTPRGSSAGDDQGISRNERVDSESVEELLEEGNAFEAEVIEGVEDAPDADQGEVRTHEVPEDDVPPEYEDKDRL